MAKSSQKVIPAELKENPEFQNFVDLLSVYTVAHNQLEKLQNNANAQLIEALDDIKPEYAELQEALTKAERASELIALKHPEWFGDKKSIKTPYGTAKLHSSTKLEVPNEEATILLIERKSEQDQNFKKDDYIRKKETLDLEALEKLDDAVLAELRIKRVKKDNFSITPAKVEMGKAVKEAVAQAA